MKKIEWLAKFAEEQKKAKATKKAVASKKVVNLNEEEFEDGMMLIVNNAKLSTAAVGSKIRYKGNIWSLVKADYSDAKGKGFVLQRVAAIDTKPLTAPAERAYTDPGNVYDYDVRETSEVPEIQQTAEQTAQEIARENAVDHCTTPAARTVESPLANGGEVAPVVEGVVPAEEAPVAEEEVAPVEESTEEAPVEDGAEEVAPAEESVEETPAEEETSAEEDFTFDDVDAEPVETEEDSAEEDEEKKATASLHKNRIIASMLKK